MAAIAAVDVAPRWHGGRAASRPRHPQLRHPGVHAARRAHRPVFEQSFSFVDGYLHPGEKPGLGVDLDVDEAGRYPYQSAYLPFNRLHDGTVHDW
jgi:L-alanine-DL-glutamate epimerase-like enolase superfamily enzyme